jgi:hypothetical protein
MIYGWDISTSIIGLSVFKDDGTFTAAMYCDLRKVDGQLAKADEFHRWLGGTSINIENTNYHFVEERLGGFAAGRTSAQVMMKLAQFNAICSYILWTYRQRPGLHNQIVYLHPSTWKSIMKHEGLIIPKGADKKELTLAFVKRKEENFVMTMSVNKNGNPQPWCYDMADAYCLGRSGYLRLCNAKENSQL